MKKPDCNPFIASIAVAVRVKVRSHMTTNDNVFLSSQLDCMVTSWVIHTATCDSDMQQQCRRWMGSIPIYCDSDNDKKTPCRLSSCVNGPLFTTSVSVDIASTLEWFWKKFDFIYPRLVLTLIRWGKCVHFHWFYEDCVDKKAMCGGLCNCNCICYLYSLSSGHAHE